MNRLVTAPLEKRELHIDNAAHDKRMYVGCRLQKYVPGCTNGGGSTPSALGVVRRRVWGWYAPAHDRFRSLTILLLEGDSGPISGNVTCEVQRIRDRPAATCKSCGRRSVGTAEDALVIS